MLLSPYLPLVCGLATTAVGAALPSLTDTVANVVEEAVGDVGDAFDDVGDAVNDLGDAAGDLLVHGAKAIVSKIPLSTFGHFNAVRLEDAIADPSLIDKALHSMLDADVDVDMVVRQMTTTPPTTTNTTNTNTTLEEEAAEVPVSCNVSAQSTRVEWYSYPPEDRHAFLDSINCLLAAPSAGGAFSPSTSRYEDFVRTHQLFTAAVHNNGLFLLWHRYFLQAFEAALRGQCGLGDRPLPWWDETRDSGAFNTSEVFTPEFFGSLPAAVGDAGVCVTDGKFANLTCNIGPGADNIPHCLSRAGNETLTEQASAEFVAYCAQRTEFGQFSGCAETGYVFLSFFFFFFLGPFLFLFLSFFPPFPFH